MNVIFAGIATQGVTLLQKEGMEALSKGLDQILSTDKIEQELEEEKQKIQALAEKNKKEKENADLKAQESKQEKEKKEEEIKEQKEKVLKKEEEKLEISTKITEKVQKQKTLRIQKDQSNDKKMKLKLDSIEKNSKIKILSNKKEKLIDEKKRLEDFILNIDSKMENKFLEIEKIKSKLSSLERSIYKLTSEIAFEKLNQMTLVKERNEIIQKLNEIQKELDKQNVLIEEKKDSIAKNKTKSNQMIQQKLILSKLINEIENEIKKLRNELSTMVDYQKTHSVLFMSKEVHISRQSERNTIQSRLSELQNNLNHYKQSFNECLRSELEFERNSKNDEFHLHTINENKKKLNENFGKVEIELKNKEDLMITSFEKIKKFEEEQSEKQDEILLLNEEKSYFQMNIDQLNEKKQSIDLNLYDEKIQKSEEEFLGCRKELKEIEIKIEDEIILISNLESEIENHKKEIHQKRTELFQEELLESKLTNEHFYFEEKEEFWDKHSEMYSNLIIAEEQIVQQFDNAKNDIKENLVPKGLKKLLQGGLKQLKEGVIDKTDFTNGIKKFCGIEEKKEKVEEKVEEVKQISKTK